MLLHNTVRNTHNNISENVHQNHYHRPAHAADPAVPSGSDGPPRASIRRHNHDSVRVLRKDVWRAAAWVSGVRRGLGGLFQSDILSQPNVYIRTIISSFNENINCDRCDSHSLGIGRSLHIILSNKLRWLNGHGGREHESLRQRQ